MKQAVLFTSAVLCASSLYALPDDPWVESDKLPAKENFHLFLLAGQSNMAGRGKVEPQDRKAHPNVLALSKEGLWGSAVAPLHFDKPVAGVGLGRSFGIRVAEAKPGVAIGLIPCAAGGSPISSWEPGGYHGQTKSHPWDDAIRRTKLAMKNGILKGILWHQGESDCTPERAPLYEKKLHSLVTRFRQELGVPEVPFILGELGRFPRPPLNDNKKLVAKAHHTLADKLPNVAFVSSEGLGHKADKIHFSAAAFREFGNRYADAYLKRFAAAKPQPASKAAPPSPAASARPNLLFAIADDWGFGHAGAYGCDWVKTPAFDRLAREGILFNRAYTPNAKCAPSRAIILTGRNSWQLEQAANHMNFFPAKFKGWPEALADNGYYVGYTGKGWGPGIANDAQGKPRRLTGKPYSTRKAKPPAGAISHNDYAANFADFLASVPEGKPWAFWYGTSEPHRGFAYQNGVKSGKKLADVDRVPAYWPDVETVRHDMLDYAVEVEHYDRHLGRILATLDQSALTQNTLVLATSDHGMPFPRCKGQAYEHSNHVPLAIRWPAGIRGTARKVDDYVSFADFAPTFLQAARLTTAQAGLQPITGRSLFDLFASDQSGQVNPKRDHVLLGKERHDVGRPRNGGYPIRGIVKDNFLYLRNHAPNRWPAGNPETGYLNCDASPVKTLLLKQRRSGDEKYWKLNFGKRPPVELYDLSKDSDCIRNLYGDRRHDRRRAELDRLLHARLLAQGDPRTRGQGQVFDAYPFVGPWNDFYEKHQAGQKTPRTGWVVPSDYEKNPLD